MAALSAGVTVANEFFAAAERFQEASDEQVERESAFWNRVALPAPNDIIPEVSGIAVLPDNRLIVTTRRGELWFIDGAYDDPPRPRFTLFASGLHESLGVAPAPQGGYYVVQRQEVTHIEDRNGDGRADYFRNVYRIPVSGNYHEFAFGPFLTPDGNLRITLMLAFNAATQAGVPWRGWMLEITPDGHMTPVAAGLRAGAGVVHSSKGFWLYTENQGEWVGTNNVAVIEPGDFMGHPESLVWSRLPGSVTKLRREDIPDTGLPRHEVARDIPEIKLPAVWFPYPTHGVSPTAIVEDTTGGRFGPFAGQYFVGDNGQCRIIRVSLEKVKGQWQGASYAFMEGLQSGVASLQFGEDGSLFVGQTDRGWRSIGIVSEGIERVRWTGTMPFEIKEVRAEPDGFTLMFTRPVDRASAEDPANYRVGGFTYGYQSAYGSPAINRLACPVRRINVAEDGMSARLGVICLREGYIHEIHAHGVRADDNGEPLLHDAAYYTLNRIPDGYRIIPLEPNEAELCVSEVPPEAYATTPKRPTVRPAHWTRSQGDRTILLGTLPGMQFDQTELHVIAGETIQLVFRNDDDMLHNFLLCAPGRGQEVGNAALLMGIDGMAMNYVPETDDVLYHTAIVQPGGSDRIFFTAPSTPGAYDFICSLPGHASIMKGIMHVVSE